MELLSYFLFALALNIDSFVAGLAYGARQIKVPLLSLLIISLISVAAISISMAGGKVLLALIPEAMAHRLGGLLLMFIGFWVLLQTRRANRTEKDRSRENSVPRLFRIHIRPLGLVIQILKEPVGPTRTAPAPSHPRRLSFWVQPWPWTPLPPVLRYPCSAFPPALLRWWWDWAISC